MIHSLIFGSLAVALLMLPGWLLASHYRVPCPLLAGFIGGAVALETLVFLLTVFGCQLSLKTMGLAWAAVYVGSLGVCRRRQPPGAEPRPAPPFWRDNWLLFIPVVPVLAVVLVRVILHPLFGIDTFFRWNRLATLMFTRRTLTFYPPTTSADYSLYSWPDGIPPTVSSLYFWCYSVGRGLAPRLTSPTVIAQYLLLLGGVFALARREFGARAGAFACALAACTPMVAWATTMGEETGLTAIALIGLLLYLPREDSDQQPVAVVAAGLAAALGANSREYGLIFPLLGVILILARRLSLRSMVIFVTVAIGLALPWYLRNWIRTGNPLFDYYVAGVFPTNARHTVLMQIYREFFSIARYSPRYWLAVPQNCWPALIGGLLGGTLFFRRASCFIIPAVAVIGLWLLSVSYTAAGLTYSLRVLNPALAVGAVLGGAACARWIPGRRYLTGALLALTLVGADAAMRAGVLPFDPYQLRLSYWSHVDAAVGVARNRPLFAEIARDAHGAGVLAQNMQAELSVHGVRVVPVWSPDVAFLFNNRITPAEAARGLLALGIRYVLTSTNPVDQTFLRKSRFFRETSAARLRLLDSNGDLKFFAIVSDGAVSARSRPPSPSSTLPKSP